MKDKEKMKIEIKIEVKRNLIIYISLYSFIIYIYHQGINDLLTVT